MKSKKTFIIASVLTLVMGAIPAISGLCLYIPWGYSRTIQSTDFMPYYYGLPVFAFLVILRAVVYRKNTYWVKETVSAVSALGLGLIHFCMPPVMYESFGKDFTNKLFVPTGFLAVLIIMILIFVFICSDLKNCKKTT